jgi:hypothetical protein
MPFNVQATVGGKHRENRPDKLVARHKGSSISEREWWGNFGYGEIQYLFALAAVTVVRRRQIGMSLRPPLKLVALG